MSRTSDGYTWSQAQGTRKGGLRCKGVITPAEKRSSAQKTYDVIVVGAGYAGLAAARDLATSNRSVLLLEARDRVGGRTYTVEDDDGFLYEMGGTWVSHHYAYLLKEMTRYNMDRDLIVCHASGSANDYFTITVPGCEPRNYSHEEAGRITQHAWDIFVNVDGKLCRDICPLPHAQLNNVRVDRKVVEEMDKRSCKDRLEEIKHLLTPVEHGVLSALILVMTGGKLENSSLWDAIRSQALLVHSSDNFTDLWTMYKLRSGQSTLARRIFDEATQFGLEYSFKTEVSSISDQSHNDVGLVQVTTSKNQVFTARRVICTIPLNVLKTIRFCPPLSAKRQEAIDIGHINFMSKVHAIVKGTDMASWSGMKSPAYLVNGFGDEITRNGDTRIVAFGGDEKENFVPEREPAKVVKAFNDLHPMEIKKTVFHNWCTDPYSNGGPAWWPPSYMSKYQDELQSPHGAIFFASGDWAHGWRASIDGALEQGSLCGIRALRELHQAGGSDDRQVKL